MGCWIPGPARYCWPAKPKSKRVEETTAAAAVIEPEKKVRRRRTTGKLNGTIKGQIKPSFASNQND